MICFSVIEDGKIKDNVQDSDRAFMLGVFLTKITTVYFLGVFCLFVFFHFFFFFLIKQITFMFHAQHNVTNFVFAIVMLRKTTALLPKSTLKLQFENVECYLNSRIYQVWNNFNF